MQADHTEISAKWLDKQADSTLTTLEWMGWGERITARGQEMEMSGSFEFSLAFCMGNLGWEMTGKRRNLT
jgi:hypothetical protein